MNGKEGAMRGQAMLGFVESECPDSTEEQELKRAIEASRLLPVVEEAKVRNLIEGSLNQGIIVHYELERFRAIGYWCLKNSQNIEEGQNSIRGT
jgi:hypothetical protein